MPASLATVAVLLKEVYEPTMQKQLNDDTIALKRVASSSSGIETTVGGRYVTFPIKTRRNSGIGARNEMEALPVHGQQGNAAGRVGLKYLYGGVQLTGQTFELANTNYQAFTSVLEQELSGCFRNILLHLVKVSESATGERVIDHLLSKKSCLIKEVL